MSEKKFRLGQRVRFQFANRTIQGVVVEGRGAIGVNGRVLYSVEFRLEPLAPELSHIELPAERLEEAESKVSDTA